MDAEYYKGVYGYEYRIEDRSGKEGFQKSEERQKSVKTAPHRLFIRQECGVAGNTGPPYSEVNFIRERRGI
jgi:hypothetical protein